MIEKTIQIQEISVDDFANRTACNTVLLLTNCV